MTVVLGKDYGFAQLLTVINLKALRHNNMKHLANGIDVKHPFIQRGGHDFLRKFIILVKELLLILRLFFFGQFIIDNALLDEFQFGLHGHKVHQITVLHRLGQFVAVSRHTAFQFENLIGVLVNFILGGSCQTNQRGVKIIENIPVLIIDRPVGFIADHQIKMTAGKQLALLVLHVVDAVHHGLIGGEHTVGGIVVLVHAQIRGRQIGQQIGEAFLRLMYQRIPVSQEQDILHPAVLQQHITQGNHRSGLAGAGSHDQQRLPAVLPAEGITDSLDGTFLIVAARDILLHHNIF